MAGDKHIVPISPAQLSAVARREATSDLAESRAFFVPSDDFSDVAHPLRPTLTDPASPEPGDEDYGFLDHQQEELISQGIKSRMAALGLRRSDVATALGVSVTTASGYVNHPGRVPYARACALAGLLQMTPWAMRQFERDASPDSVPRKVPVTVADAYSTLSARDRARVDDMVLRLAGKSD